MLSNYKGSPRGSQWNKWDLHIHTPSSIIQGYGGDPNDESTWEKYFKALEALPKEIKAVGINDYFFIDGYRRVKAAKDLGRFANLELILPVVELRIESFAGHKKLNKINFHVIFSDTELSADVIETQFLNGLGVEYQLSDGRTWGGRVSNKQLLQQFGQAIIDSTPESKKPNDSPLIVGFNNAAFSLDRVRDLLKETRFQGKVLTAVGITEWDDMRFESATAIKRDIIHSADFVFVASPDHHSYYNRKEQLKNHEVNSKLLDCSDAHHYADSGKRMCLGETFSWLKADLTFEGLRRVAQCFDERVAIKPIGDIPNKLKKIQNNLTKYIRGIEIRKNVDSDLEEKWFDCYVPLNPGLVAIIGNQGNGKSALTDIIALCGNTKTIEFSFLTREKFRDNQNKAREFIATLKWEDGSQVDKRLDGRIDDTDFEQVRYVPQGFFDLVTNETVVQKGGKFYGEIEKAVFSHVAKSDRLGCADINSLIKIKTDQINQGLSSLRQELSNLNTQIVEIELACLPKEITRIKNEIQAKENEIISLEAEPPKPVEEPKESTAVNQEIEKLREKEQQLTEQINQLKDSLSSNKLKREFLKQKRDAIHEQQRQLQDFITSLQSEFDDAGFELDVPRMVKVQFETEEIEKLIIQLNSEISTTTQQIDIHNEDSLAFQLQTIKLERENSEKELKQVNQTYQTYRSAYIKWQDDIKELKGNVDSVGSLKWLEEELTKSTVSKPKKLEELKELRRQKSRVIYERIQEISRIYQKLTNPVQQHIESEPLTREKYKMRFAIDLVEHNLGNKLFSIIKRSGSHTFIGIPDGDEKLQELCDDYDFGSASNAVEFAETLLDKLKRNHNWDTPKEIDIQKILRKGKEISEVYNLIFGLEYLTSEYSITLNGKPLKQLSPGERGILLLVFYLVIDKGDMPLIIDQPEGNLNNQSIFKNLVPVFKQAKAKRQIIVVTHNPNLAVVSDAEQIIHAKIDYEDGNRVEFTGGALENPHFKKLSLDVLEGTPPAFQARKETYEVG